MIVSKGNFTGVSPKAYPIGSRPSRSYPSIGYDIGKRIVRYSGYASKIEQYYPEKLIQRPYKKPISTAFDFARLQKRIWKKKKRYVAKHCQFNQKYCQ